MTLYQPLGHTVAPYKAMDCFVLCPSAVMHDGLAMGLLDLECAKSLLILSGN